MNVYESFSLISLKSEYYSLNYMYYHINTSTRTITCEYIRIQSIDLVRPWMLYLSFLNVEKIFEESVSKFSRIRLWIDL
jgi:hypothetical protein